MTVLIKTLARMGLLKEDVAYRFLRASIVIICFFFGYQKRFDYEANGRIPFFTLSALGFVATVTIIPFMRMVGRCRQADFPPL